MGLARLIAREARRKFIIDGKVRAYWGPCGLKRLVTRAFTVLLREGPGAAAGRFRQIADRAVSGMGYSDWVEKYDRLTDQDRARIRAQVATLARRPLVSILMPTYNTPEPWLRAAIESVLAQLYPDWELCIADDASTVPHVRKVLDEYAARDARVKLAYRESNGHISEATNTALGIAAGEFIALMDHDDLIPAHALFELAARVNEDPALDMVYSDEDKLDVEGHRYDPFFKPDWCPDYLESCMYTAHLALYRRSIVQRIGGFRTECNGAQDYDFVLRFTEQTERIGHVAKVLYHWRAVPGSTAASMEQKSYVVEAGKRALQGRLARTGRVGEVELGRFAASFSVRTKLAREPMVSIVMPTAGGARTVRGREINLVMHCIAGIRSLATYRNYEIILVDNGDLAPEVKRALEREQCRFITYNEPRFNIAEKLNLGASIAKGEYLLLLNDDIEIISPDWIEAMLEQALKPGVGAVGAKLLYENDTLQHVGIAHHRGLPDHVRKMYPRNDPGYMFSTVAVRNYLAVTGACLLTPADLYRQVGGFTEAFGINYNDVDYCLKLRKIGYRAVYTPHAELYHFESASRVAEVSPEEISLFLARWRDVTWKDPYYNTDYLQPSPPDFTLHLRA
jgi:O-antigen biosynthesis protein